MNFPSSPSLNQTYQYAGTTYTWNGVSWVSSGSQNDLKVPTGGVTGQALIKKSDSDFDFEWKENSVFENAVLVKNSAVLMPKPPTNTSTTATAAVFISGDKNFANWVFTGAGSNITYNYSSPDGIFPGWGCFALNCATSGASLSSLGFNAPFLTQTQRYSRSIICAGFGQTATGTQKYQVGISMLTPANMTGFTIGNNASKVYFEYSNNQTIKLYYTFSNEQANIIDTGITVTDIQNFLFEFEKQKNSDLWVVKIKSAQTENTIYTYTFNTFGQTFNGVTTFYPAVLKITTDANTGTLNVYSIYSEYSL